MRAAETHEGGQMPRASGGPEWLKDPHTIDAKAFRTAGTSQMNNKEAPSHSPVRCVET